MTSVFLKWTTAADLLDGYTEAFSKLGLSIKKVVQVATDGSNVNLKFRNDLHDLLKSDDHTHWRTQRLGACGVVLRFTTSQLASLVAPSALPKIME